ncbi:MAG: energy transducer TonB [Acidobacteriota bacterium]
MQEKGLFADAFINQPSIAKRLLTEFSEATREFSHDPAGYITSAIKGDGIGGKRRQMNLLYGLAVAMMVFSTAFIGVLAAYTIAHAKDGEKTDEQQEFIALANPQDFQEQTIDMPKGKEKAGGGGGGGRKSATPPSQGQLPKFDLKPPIIAPRPEPTLRPPALPVPETVQVDPRLQPKRDDLAPTGLPTGVPGPPSPGPGEGGGIGSGKGGGIGSGDGTGVGPGRGYNMGGGDPNIGGGDGNRNPDGSAKSVDSRPVALNYPRPNYTEEARKNKIQGAVLVRVLVGADGSVKSVRVSRGLPDGLNEEAIRAAYQIRFRPATKNGQPVAYWVNVQIDFNLR